jgi:hypothetical protein
MTDDRADHVVAESGGGVLHSVALAAAIAMMAGACAAAWFAYRRSRSRHEELNALTRWEDEGGSPVMRSVAEGSARQALRACRLMSI